MKWKLSIEADVVKGQWDERYHAYLWYEFFYIIAEGGGKAYLYQWRFSSWERAWEQLGVIRDGKISPRRCVGKWSRVRGVRAMKESVDILEVLRKRCG